MSQAWIERQRKARERNIRTELLDTNDPEKQIKIEVYYSEGGLGMFSGETTARGYWMSATPVNIKVSDGVVLTTTTAFTGTRTLLEEATRFNKKRIGELAANAATNPARNAVLNATLAKNGLTLKEATPALVS